LDEFGRTELFNNSRINRRLDDSGLRSVFDYLEQQKHVEWKDKGKRRCNIYWRRPDEWGQLLHEWASANGLLNTVVTLYDLTQGEDTARECELGNNGWISWVYVERDKTMEKVSAFHGLDRDVLLKAIQSLEDQKRAALVDYNGELSGVKFL